MMNHKGKGIALLLGNPGGSDDSEDNAPTSSKQGGSDVSDKEVSLFRQIRKAIENKDDEAGAIAYKALKYECESEDDGDNSSD